MLFVKVSFHDELLGATSWIRCVDFLPVVVNHDISEDDQSHIRHWIALRFDLLYNFFSSAPQKSFLSFRRNKFSVSLILCMAPLSYTVSKCLYCVLATTEKSCRRHFLPRRHTQRPE